MKHGLLVTLAAVLLAPPAMAQGDTSCIVDYETMEVRSLLTSDPVTMLPEQTMGNYAWATESTVRVAGEDYEKYGLPRVVDRAELDFFGFKDSVPFMREIGTGPDPEVIYGLVDGIECEVQAYQRVAR